MRELKLRAWIKEKNKMCQVHSIHMGTKKVIVSIAMGNRSLQFEQVELMQYTGLKDKNGKEIYEGDVVESATMKYSVGETIKGVVKYADKWATFYLAIKNRHGVGIALDSVHAWYYDEDGEISVEIIGNRFENPELLEVV